jgi:hypothetical protein
MRKRAILQGCVAWILAQMSFPVRLKKDSAARLEIAIICKDKPEIASRITPSLTRTKDDTGCLTSWLEDCRIDFVLAQTLFSQARTITSEMPWIVSSHSKTQAVYTRLCTDLDVLRVVTRQWNHGPWTHASCMVYTHCVISVFSGQGPCPVMAATRAAARISQRLLQAPSTR